MKKRILSLLLALVLLVGLLPTVSLAADGSGSVDVYIIGRDELITYQQIDLDEAKQIDVSSYSSSTAEGTTSLHAIVAALQKEDMLNTFECTGGYITEIAGLVAGRPNYMSGWMYKLNKVFPDVGVAESPLKDGDEIVLFWEQGLEGQQYCQFKEGRKAEIEVGKKLTLSPEMTLLDTENGLGKEAIFTSTRTDKLNMQVYVDGIPYLSSIAATKGTVDVYFSTPGVHIVTAKVVNKAGVGAIESYLTLPVCVVTVTGEALASSGQLTKLDVLTRNGDPLQTITIDDNVSDYHISVPSSVTGVKLQGELNELATKNKAAMSAHYLTTTDSTTASSIKSIGMPKKVTGNPADCPNALAIGDNTITVYLTAGETTHAPTIYTLHINRDTSSPLATINKLNVTLGEAELASSAAEDLLNGQLKLHYKKANGSDATCGSYLQDKNVREYTVYVPYEAQTLQVTPVVIANGTYTVLDADENVLDSKNIPFAAEKAEAVYTVKTTSSDGTGTETYTLTVIRRPNVALTNASIDCGRLWLPGLIPGYDEVKFFVTDPDAATYKLNIEATAGTSIYRDSIEPENLLTSGEISGTTPKADTNIANDVQLFLVGKNADGSDYIRTVTLSVLAIKNAPELVELVSSPSQHMVNTPYDTGMGSAMLSSFGGYMTVYFKNPLKNDPNNPYGLDFYVNGNPNYPNVWSFSEPAQIYVAQDKDGDGEPDKWYALAGSEHYEDTTYWDYEITYTDEGNRKVRWEDNYGNTGYVCELSTGSNFPSSKVQTVNSRYRTQYQSGVLTLGGILIGPVKSEETIHAPVTIFGYGDCYPASQTLGQGAANPYRDPGLSEIDSSLTGEAWEKAMTDQYGKSSHGDAMDISWAVDEDGTPVYLDEISFVRAMSAINVDSGIFSEKSPEISGVDRLSSDRREQPVGISDLPDAITINGKAVDLSRIHPVNGQAAATVYLAEGEQSAAITVEAGDRNVILGNRYRKSYTYETVSETGRLVRIITQDGEKEPNILVLNIQRYSEDYIAAEPAEKLIDAIGEVTAASGDAIRAARKAYDALTDEQKKLVSNYQDLLDAEARYRELTKPVTPVTPVTPGAPKDDTAKPDASGFADVSKNDWYFDAVQYALENGLMNGTSAAAFSPNADTTRGMIVTILARLDGADTTGTPWYAAGREWAMKNGISDGTRMESKITREQLAAMLFRYAALKGYDVSASADISSYADAASVSGWALGAMRWAVGSGLINGRTAATLVPQGTATRAEVASILMRFMQKFAK